MIEAGHASHKGLARALNEDSYWADTRRGLFLVVDGMGGHGRGEVAAALVRDALVTAIGSGRGVGTAIREAADAVTELTAPAADQIPSGAALALLKIDGNQYAAVRIGDTRVYLWQRGAQRLVGGGDPAPADNAPPTPPDAEAASPPERSHNRATQALGVTRTPDLTVEPFVGKLERGMQFLLCSDGLSEELDDAHIAAVVARTDLAAQECAEHLLLDALDAGGRDNISIVLVRIG